MGKCPSGASCSSRTIEQENMGTSTERIARKGKTVQRVFIDGSGQRPDRTGSGYAFVNVTTGKKGVHRVDGLTNNQAEWRALRFAVRRLRPGSEAVILSDSALVVNQFNQEWEINNPNLDDIYHDILQIAKARSLRLNVIWIPRQKNIADKLLLEKGKTDET
jgi:ribonuclease HI